MSLDKELKKELESKGFLGKAIYDTIIEMAKDDRWSRYIRGYATQLELESRKKKKRKAFVFR